MEIFALFMVCGIFTTLLIPETKRVSLEHLAEKYHDDIQHNREEDADLETSD